MTSGGEINHETCDGLTRMSHALLQLGCGVVEVFGEVI
jgi:hypothetical protein